MITVATRPDTGAPPDERVWTIVHSVRSRIVDDVLPALGQPIMGDARPGDAIPASGVVAARVDLLDACGLLLDALMLLDGDA